MAQYPMLKSLMSTLSVQSTEEEFVQKVVPYLVEVWLAGYARTTAVADIVETRAAGFSYLFDIQAERLIAAWGISRGRSSEPRPAARMQGHPIGAGALYHRGHAIPHTLGGPVDINLVPQLGKVNVGPFRPLEKKAVATPGSLYFTYWTYRKASLGKGGRPEQKPTGVDQGLLLLGKAPEVSTFGN
jgi:hypothetical protein